jgi:DNA topoisomerase-3
VEQLNWLEVFTYEKWADSVLPKFYEGQQFKPQLSLPQGSTVAPSYLTEADLIDKMDKNGIGTDATIHEHIKNVQERDYCRKRGISLIPTPLGTTLVGAYENIGVELYKPYLRA